MSCPSQCDMHTICSCDALKWCWFLKFYTCKIPLIVMYFPCVLQLEPGSAHLCVHHGLPHHPLSTACIWATLPPHDSPLNGDWYQAVWYVYSRWAERICWLWLHAAGECVQDVILLLSSMQSYYRHNCVLGARCEVLPWRALGGRHHRGVAVQSPQPRPERWLSHR